MLKIEEYFATAREREEIRLRRLLGKEPPWTNDKIFQTWRFCNVHRENDRTTVWFRVNIRNKLEGWKLVKATFIFRWFNRIETAEKILDLLLGHWDSEEAKERLKGMRPVVTGAYMLKTPDYYSKLDGVLWAIDHSLSKLKLMHESWGPYLKSAWADLCELPYHGPFMSYEVVTDLRHTHILDKAQDIMTWANAGPGCTRGLGRVFNLEFNRNSKKDQKEMQHLMQEILQASKTYWPKNWLQWEMREAEHWACEYEKYCNAKEGRKLKRRYQ